jgi:two-component system, cell cycle sensor histidine kinase DivJ
VTVFESPSAFSDGFRALVHPAARTSPQDAARHCSFIATRLFGGALALAAFPIYLALWGAPSLIAAIAFAWLMTPIAIALFLSRTGRLDDAQILSVLSFSGLVAFLAVITGGPLSPLLAWIVVVPAEAALSGSRRVVAAAIAGAISAIAVVCALAAGGLIPTDFLLDGPAWAWPALGALPATLYVGVLAFAGNLAASGTDDTARAQALIVHCPDAIARQRRNGNLTFVSPAAGELVEADTSDLLGDGLFRRIHVSDRPAYLKALDDAAEGSAAMAAFRLRRGDGAEADWLWIEMRCRAATQHCGSDSGDLVTVLRDISARKATEQDMTAAFEEMPSAPAWRNPAFSPGSAMSCGRRSTPSSASRRSCRRRCSASSNRTATANMPS